MLIVVSIIIIIVVVVNGGYTVGVLVIICSHGCSILSRFLFVNLFQIVFLYQSYLFSVAY